MKNSKMNSYFESATNPLDIDSLINFHKKTFGGYTMSLATDVAPEVVPPVVEPPAAPEVTGFTAEDIEKARREEKDKMYARLEQEKKQREAFEAQVSDLLAAQQSAAQKEAEALAAAEAATRKKAEEDMSAKELIAQRDAEYQAELARIRAESEQQFQQLQQERELERATLEKDRQMAELRAYAQAKVTENQDSIAPQLRDFITGNSPEEIDASVEMIKAKSAELARDALEAVRAQTAQQRGVSPYGYAPNGPLETEGATRQLSAEDIANMDMREYAKLRATIPGLNGSNSNRGLYS